ncbi:transporter substrate-binding domain-containing protein [Ideonella sp. TBM-1]|uniref:Transporter substrate-binding domain-containing protein n=1 Tax=Ideonella livida TaxID=2707176 RepID=A0A7C9PKH4_9BURK|nr:transporter substrate-binding domain-containing protein [Ideonella livida]NDY93292.1 transporter substrate-binding domain-containing protein [Ideonella livida]
MASLLAGLVLVALAPRAGAQDGDTLQRIAETGTIRLGHRESSVPFSYYDQRHQVVGYSQELMLRVLDTIKAELKLPALTLQLVPVTSQNRMALVQNGTVDLECGSTTHNRERERQVAFSVSIFVVELRMMVRRGSPVKDLADLKGRRVVVTAGTTSERALLLHRERSAQDFTIVLARDHDTAFKVLESRQAEVFLLDDALLHGIRAKSARPEDWQVVGQPMATEAYACMMRRGDAAFKRVVDRGLSQLMQSGEALRLYRRWFQRPIPPRNLNLDMPPSERLLQLYRQPEDRPLN